MPKIKYDYFLMHEQSIKLMRNFRAVLSQDLVDLQEMKEMSIIENESQLPWVGLYFIIVACGPATAAELSTEKMKIRYALPFRKYSVHQFSYLAFGYSSSPCTVSLGKCQCKLFM
jgi:hypothetical protein